jgi:predicted transcriptional regulator
MKLKRNRLEVIRDLLVILRENKKVRITHLIYKANLSNNSIKSYLEELIKNGFIVEKVEDKNRFFEITLKGNEFIQEFNKMKIFSESYGLG